MLTWRIYVGVVLAAAICSATFTACQAQGDGHQALMDEIERDVQMPKYARPLNAYGRSYALVGPDKVRAVYLLPLPPFPYRANQCSTITPDGKLRRCTEAEIEQGRHQDEQIANSRPAAGRQRWFDNPENLPEINDGGCMQITVEYEIVTKRFLRVECNGNA